MAVADQEGPGWWVECSVFARIRRADCRLSSRVPTSSTQSRPGRSGEGRRKAAEAIKDGERRASAGRVGLQTAEMVSKLRKGWSKNGKKGDDIWCGAVRCGGGLGSAVEGRDRQIAVGVSV